MSWAEYVTAKTQQRQQAAIAAQVGVNQSTVSRWKSGKGEPSAENVIDFARAVGDSPLVALVHAGLVHPSEVGAVQLEPRASDLETRDLLQELGRRLGITLVEGRRTG